MAKLSSGIRSLSVLPVLFLVFVAQSVLADQIPDCLSKGDLLPENDAQVLAWKASTPNQYLARAHVTGVVSQIDPDHSGHNHFIAQIGPNDTDTLEVVYSQDFGALPDVTVGMKVEACGDYITSNAPAGPYPASPAGAIIHWVHTNPRGRGHDSGYLALDGVVYGLGADTGGGRRKYSSDSSDN